MADLEKGMIEFNPIGIIRTPYQDWAPHRPVEQRGPIGKTRVILDEKYAEGLKGLERFSHIMVVFHIDRAKPPQMEVSPPWAKGTKIGMFAGRTPNRPCPIGISVVRLERIEGTELITWPLDVLDQTPLLDVKPYFGSLDAIPDANDGWAEDLDGKDHIFEHLRGLPHEHDHGHSHDQPHGHQHEHAHDHGHSHSHDGSKTHAHEHKHDHEHDHDHQHGHEHDHDHSHGDDHAHEHSNGHPHVHEHDDEK
jgi:tRNA (adenine37-N6)-methyltransferase